MELFRAGALDVLVATTVIEVGVDVPNATVMVILDADRFGIAQLHQLRGRVGRGEHASVCFLIADPTTSDGEERLAALVRSTDGFELAEVDLDLRGEGTIMGERQKGRNDLKLASLRRDREWVERALEKLPDHQRIPLVLYHFEDLPYEDIAKKTRVSLSKVKTDILRGREALAKILVRSGASHEQFEN